jgi:tRNA pseudouridine38-40 synthase
VTTQYDDEPAAPVGDGGLVRLRLDLAYDGTDFSGWAAQPGRRTVEGTLTDALAVVLRLREGLKLTVAGRTDAGVHAAGQVAHVDVPEPIDCEQLTRRLAGVLPDDVVVRGVRIAPAGFDARFAGIGRHYLYRVTDQLPDPLRRRDTLAWPRPLDAGAMQTAADGLVGEHDFAAYCRQRPGATTVRTLRALQVERTGPLVSVMPWADAFCHNQVRAMVGALLAVGEGRRPPEWPREVLLAGVRDSAVTVAPPHGLTLVRVDYPPDEQLADRARKARARRDEPGERTSP